MLEWQGSAPPLSEPVVQAAELILGVRLPESYRRLVMQFPEGRPVRNAIRVLHPEGAWESCLGVLLTLDPRRSENVFTYLQNSGQEGSLPAGLVPFADDGGGDLLCLDYRASPSQEPSVVYWAHELGGAEGLVPIASSFDGFLELLG